MLLQGCNIKEGCFYASYKLWNFSNSLKKVAETNLVIRPSNETTSTERIYKAKLMDGNRSLQSVFYRKAKGNFRVASKPLF